MIKKIIGYKAKIKTPWCKKGVVFQAQNINDVKDFIFLGTDKIFPSFYPDLFEPVYEEEPLKVVYDFINSHWSKWDSQENNLVKSMSRDLLDLVPDLAEKIKNNSN